MCYYTQAISIPLVVAEWGFCIGDVKPENYASPSSWEAYRDRQLTTNFEFWVEILCVPTCFHMRIPKPCPSVCPSVRTPRKEITIASSISVLLSDSYISKWYINGKVFTSTTAWEPKNLKNFLKKVRNSNFDLCWRAEITISSSISVLQ